MRHNITVKMERYVTPETQVTEVLTEGFICASNFSKVKSFTPQVKAYEEDAVPNIDFNE